jgi:hypothetical protein
MEKRVKASEVTMSELKSMLKTLIGEIDTQSLSITELRKRMDKKVVDSTCEESTGGSSQAESRLPGKKANCAVEELDSGSLQNSSEQLDQKISATTTVTPLVNHMSVVEEIEEINDASKDGGVEVVTNTSIDEGEEVRIKQIDYGSESIVTAMLLKAVNSELMGRR